MTETLHAVTVKIGVVRPDSPEGERKLLSSLSSLQGVQQAHLGA